MIRQDRIGRPDLILTSDWHLREDTPVCRTDDFWKAQWEKVLFVSELQKRFRCPVVHGGDLGNHWKWSPFLLSTAILDIPKDFRTVYGQHDLPQHNLKLAFKSGLYTLAMSRTLSITSGVHFGQEPANQHCQILGRKVLIWHRLVWQGKLPWPGCIAPSAEGVLKKYPDYDLIVTGDNHKPFVAERKGRLLVSPGCLTRQKADEAEHKPRVYLWYAKSNTVSPVFLPIEEGVISREHIVQAERRDDRIEAFVGRLDSDWNMELSFEQNLVVFRQQNRKVRASVMAIVERAIERGKGNAD